MTSVYLIDWCKPLLKRKTLFRKQTTFQTYLAFFTLFIKSHRLSDSCFPELAGQSLFMATGSSMSITTVILFIFCMWEEKCQFRLVPNTDTSVTIECEVLLLLWVRGLYSGHRITFIRAWSMCVWLCRVSEFRKKTGNNHSVLYVSCDIRHLQNAQLTRSRHFIPGTWFMQRALALKIMSL